MLEREYSFICKFREKLLPQSELELGPSYFLG